MSENKETATEVAVIERQSTLIAEANSQRSTIANLFTESQLKSGDMSRSFMMPSDEEYEELPIELSERHWVLEDESGNLKRPGEDGTVKTFVVINTEAIRKRPSKVEADNGKLVDVDGVLLATAEVDKESGEVIQVNYWCPQTEIKNIVRAAVSSGQLLENNHCTKIKLMFDGAGKSKKGNKFFKFKSRILIAKNAFNAVDKSALNDAAKDFENE